MEIVYTLVSSLMGGGSPQAVISMFAFAAAGEITDARARALATVAVGLISVILGGIAWASGRGSGNKRLFAGAALLLGLIGALASSMHIAGSTGFGTGGGRAGAIVALVLSLAGTFLGAVKVLPFNQSRENPSTK